MKEMFSPGNMHRAKRKKQQGNGKKEKRKQSKKVNLSQEAGTKGKDLRKNGAK